MKLSVRSVRVPARKLPRLPTLPQQASNLFVKSSDMHLSHLNYASSRLDYLV